ncbi:transposase [Streptomyces sp. NPDC000348]|uniref:transposase n=1 Tax=Streptomyces sp. NPDC000348 TaxID=3364538 RepID=UPI00368CCA1B
MTGPVPRDRDNSFDPQIAKKRRRLLTAVDEMVLSLSARGLTHGTPPLRFRETRVEHAEWRWLFPPAVPVAPVTMAGAVRRLPESRVPGRPGHHRQRRRTPPTSSSEPAPQRRTPCRGPGAPARHVRRVRHLARPGRRFRARSRPPLPARRRHPVPRRRLPHRLPPARPRRLPRFPASPLPSARPGSRRHRGPDRAPCLASCTAAQGDSSRRHRQNSPYGRRPCGDASSERASSERQDGCRCPGRDTERRSRRFDSHHRNARSDSLREPRRCSTPCARGNRSSPPDRI